jgi:zinc-ribbon domain
MAICSRCGATLNPNASFCSNCGTAQAANPGVVPQFVPPSAVAGVAYAPAAAGPQKKGHPVLKVLGIIFAVFVGFAIWGAILQSNHTGGQGSTSVNSGSRTSPLEESRQMCAEIEQHIQHSMAAKIKVQCASGKADDGTLGLGIGFAAPVLALDNKARRDGLFIAAGAAGWAMSDHPSVPIAQVYVTDSTGIAFVVSGSFTRLVSEKIGDKTWSVDEGGQQVIRVAKRVKLTDIH